MSLIDNVRTTAEREEIEKFVIQLLESVKTTGKISIVDQIASSLPALRGSDLVLSKDIRWWTGRDVLGTSYSTNLAFVHCIESLLKNLLPPYANLDALLGLCAEVMRNADQNRDEEPDDSEDPVGPPLQNIMFERSAQRITAVLEAEAAGNDEELEATFVASRVSYGLMEKMFSRSDATEQANFVEMMKETNLVPQMLEEMDVVSRIAVGNMQNRMGNLFDCCYSCYLTSFKLSCLSSGLMELLCCSLFS